MIEDVEEPRARRLHLVSKIRALDIKVQRAGDHGRAFGEAEIQQYIVGQRGLEHAGDPDGPDLLQHGSPITAGQTWARLRTKVLLDGHLADRDIATHDDV